MREEKLLGKTRCKREKSVLGMVGDCLLATYCVPKENKVFNSQRGLYRLMVWCFCKIDVCTWNVRLTYSTIPISIKIRIFYFSLKHQLPLQTRYTAHCLILFNIANFQPCSRTTKSGCFIVLLSEKQWNSLVSSPPTCYTVAFHAVSFPTQVLFNLNLLTLFHSLLCLICFFVSLTPPFSLDFRL